MKQEILKEFLFVGTQLYNDSVRKAIYEQKIVPHGNKSWLSLKEGVERIRTETFAFYTLLDSDELLLLSFRFRVIGF